MSLHKLCWYPSGYVGNSSGGSDQCGGDNGMVLDISLRCDQQDLLKVWMDRVRGQEGSRKTPRFMALVRVAID